MRDLVKHEYQYNQCRSWLIMNLDETEDGFKKNSSTKENKPDNNTVEVEWYFPKIVNEDGSSESYPYGILPIEYLDKLIRINGNRYVMYSTKENTKLFKELVKKRIIEVLNEEENHYNIMKEKTEKAIAYLESEE